MKRDHPNKHSCYSGGKGGVHSAYANEWCCGNSDDSNGGTHDGTAATTPSSSSSNSLSSMVEEGPQQQQPGTRHCRRCNVVITGGSRGIGKAMVERFAAAGCRVLFTYLSTSKEEAHRVGRDATTSASGLGQCDVTAARLDIGDHGSVQAFAKTVDEWRAGHAVDILVNNAALGSKTVENYYASKQQEGQEQTTDGGPRNGRCSGSAGDGRRKEEEGGEKPQEIPHRDAHEGNGHLRNGEGLNSSSSGEDLTREQQQQLLIQEQQVVIQQQQLVIQQQQQQQQRVWEDEALMRVNALGPVWLTEALLPFMRKAVSTEPSFSSALLTDNRHLLLSSNTCPSTTTTTSIPQTASSSSSTEAIQPLRDTPAPPLASGGGEGLPPVMFGKALHSTVMFIGSVGGGSASVLPLPSAKIADMMSKAALAYAVKHLAACHVRTEVDFLSICPGATLTDMFKESTLNTMENPERFVDSMPKRRIIPPAEVAESVFWLCTSPAGRIFHGAVLDASQGLAVRPGLVTEGHG